MRFAYFPGCKIARHLPEYGAGVEAVCSVLGIELAPLEFACCGWPLRDESYFASVYSAAYNLALAGQEGLAIMTPCKCCFGQLKHAQARLRSSPKLAAEVRRHLALDGLRPGQPEVHHLLSILGDDAVLQAVGKNVVSPLTGFKAACHYGCHALRPSSVTGFDDPLNPTVFERVVASLGAEAVPWDLRLECCGHPVLERDREISLGLMEAKLSSARAAGADAVVTACTYCQMQFDTERKRLPAEHVLQNAPQAVLITQLMSRAFGLSISGSKDVNSA